jgi:hypothetical protein
MPNIIRIKRRNAAGAPGSPLNLANAELAFNEADYTLYYGYGSNGLNNTATIIVPIAGSGAFLPRAEFNSNATIFYTTGTQIVTGAKTFNRGLYSITPLVSDSGTTVATTAFVKNQSYLTRNQNITFTGDATGTGSTSVVLTLSNAGIAGTYTKVTTDSKGRVTSGRTLASGDIPTIDVSQIYNFDTQVRTNRLDQLASPISNINFNSQNIINLADPINAQDAATKTYVDATKQGLDIKDSVRVATISNITLSGIQIIDGVVLNIGDRVLVKEQSSASQNGIYIVSVDSWIRSSDANTNSKVSAGLFVFVEDGENNGDCGFVLITNNPIALGTTNLSFTQFNGAGQLYAASGISKAGNTFYAVGTPDRISISSNGIDISNNYIGQASISTLGTITTGIWNGSVISSTYGGLGLNSVLNGLIKGNGSSYSAAIAGTDYAAASHTHLVSDITNFNSSVSGIVLAVGSSQYAPIVSPVLTGIPIAPTASVDTNTNQIATTAFILNQASISAPLNASIAKAGISLRYAREDHTHNAQTIALTGDINGTGTDTFNTTISSGVVTYNKIQIVSSADKLLGRSSSGAGIIEEISCTASGRALIASSTPTDMRMVLGLGSLSTSTGINITGDVIANYSNSTLISTVTKINGVSLSGLNTGLLKNTTDTGVPSIAIAGIDYAAASHAHISSDITDFNSSVSGILPVKNIVAGSNITISVSSGNYTISSNGSAVNDDQNILANQIFG